MRKKGGGGRKTRYREGQKIASVSSEKRVESGAEKTASVKARARVFGKR